jgi:hypothetical protein
MQILDSGIIDINPIEQYQMGCGPNHLFVKETLTNLECNYIILKSKSKLMLIISLDLLYAGDEIKRGLKSKLSKNISSDSIFIFASHTHYAPMTDSKKPKLGTYNPRYVEFLIDKIANIINKSINKSATEILSINLKRYESGVIVGRRSKKFLSLSGKRLKIFGISMSPNIVDRRQTLSHFIEINSREGLKAIIWHFPCHPTSIPYEGKFDSGYIGQIRNRYRIQRNAEIPFIFLQGFSGDLRPPSHFSKTKNLLDNVRKLLFGSWFIDFTHERYESWLSDIGREILDENGNLESNLQIKATGSEIESRLVKIPSSDLYISKKGDERYVEFARLTIGEIEIIGVEAEVVSEYQLFLNELSFGKALIGVGCMGDVFGYLPTRKQIREGGYESRGYLKYFELKKLNSQIETKTKSTISKLLKSQE